MDGDRRALGDGIQLLGGGGGGLAQVDAAVGDGGVGIARRRQPGSAGGGHLGFLHVLLEDIAGAAIVLDAVEVARRAGDFHDVALGDAADHVGSRGAGGGAHIGCVGDHAREGIAGCRRRDGRHHQQHHRQEEHQAGRLHPLPNSHVESSVFLQYPGDIGRFITVKVYHDYFTTEKRYCQRRIVTFTKKFHVFETNRCNFASENVILPSCTGHFGCILPVEGRDAL